MSMFGAQSQGGAQASQGSDLEQIEQEQIHFHSISGDYQLRLASPWPTSNLPPTSASLLSVASTRGLAAAAGPDALVIAKTDSIRSAFPLGDDKPEGKTRPFTPEATISVPRVSQVAFSSDESCLVVVAEQGGGLAVYETDAITNGSKDPAFQIGTNGVGVRQLLPNPNSAAEYASKFTIVLETGQLLLADLKARALAQTSGGNAVFHENVTSACWSRLGKQIIAGKSDGTAVQIDPKGDVKAEIPVPPKLPELAGSSAGQMALMSIYWLETNELLLVHTPTGGSSGGYGMSDDTPADPVWHIARRENAKSTSWEFQTLIDPAPGSMMSERTPAHQYVQRLKDWPPNLDDVLLTISTTATDVGMITKASAPLTSQTPIVGTYVTTLPIDTHRAGLPMSEADNISDTSPIGMAMDLSSKQLVPGPMPTDSEVKESPVPLPCLYVLNNEGVLRGWYISYSASIREAKAYPDLIAAGGPRPLDQKTTGTAAAAASRPTSSAGSTPGFGGFGAMAPPPKPATPTAASPTFGAPAFGQSSTPAFGAPSLGSKPSPWGAPTASTGGAASPASKGLAFGSSTAIGGGGGFGQVGGIGQKASPWGTASPAPASSFGKPSTLFGGSAAPQSPFANLDGNKDGEQKPAQSPFGGNAGAASPFASILNKANEQKPTSSVFGGGQPTSTFGGLGATPEQQKANKSAFAAFGAKPALPTGSSFGSTATLGTGSSFGQLSTVGGTPSLFGTPSNNSSGLSWGQPSKPASREETMGEEDTPTKLAEETKPSGLFSGGFKLGSTFKGDGSAKDDLPKPENPGASLFGTGFGSALGEAAKKPAEQSPVTPIKKEPGAEEGSKLQDIPVATSTTPAGVPAPAKQDDPLTYKAKRFAGDLPPMDVPGDDPLTYKPKRFAGDVLPIEPSSPKVKAEESPGKEDEAPLAGSPPVDLGSATFSEAARSEEELPAGPEDEDDEVWSEEEDEGEEGEVDDEEDEDDDDEREVTDPKGLSAFEARLHPASPKRAEQAAEESTTPATERKPSQLPSYTPAGLPKHNVNFAPPVQESPRSPSPVRSVTAPMQQKPTFGTFAKPSLPAQLGRTSSFGKSSQPAQPQRIAVPPSKLAERPASPVKPAEPTAGDLEDEDDAQVQAILESAPEPTVDVPEFLAHQDYVGHSEKEGIGGQIERVYRDINSMVDTLGLNAHALQGFVAGHEQLKAAGERGPEDLEDGDWTLDEVSDLAGVQEYIYDNLQDGQLRDVPGLLSDLRDEGEEFALVKAKAADVRKRVKAHTDPELLAKQRGAPLAAETQAQQSELRQGVQRVQTLLGQVEEAMSLLRADLASAAAANTSANATGNVVPTVEAVTNTIQKMTAMIQEKSGDIDVLESQIRRLPGGLASLRLEDDYEDQLVASLAGNKFLNCSASSTPRASRPRMLANGDAPGLGGMLGNRFRTPPSQSGGRRSVLFSPEASRLGMSTSSANGTPRRKMADVTEVEVQAYRAKAGRRNKVLGALRKEVEGKAVRIVKLEG